MKQNNILIVLAIIVVLAAMINVTLTINKLGSLKTLTGFATTSTGDVNISVETSVNINFSIREINWSYGMVTQGQTEATLSTSDGSVTNGNWSAIDRGLTVQNLGNVNVSLYLKGGKTNVSFIGGTNPDYEWNISSLEAGSCGDPKGISLSVFADVNGTAGDKGTLVCGNFSFDDTHDLIEIDIKLVVPYDSTKGSLSDIITATAVANP